MHLCQIIPITLAFSRNPHDNRFASPLPTSNFSMTACSCHPLHKPNFFMMWWSCRPDHGASYPDYLPEPDNQRGRKESVESVEVPLGRPCCLNPLWLGTGSIVLMVQEGSKSVRRIPQAPVSSTRWQVIGVLYKRALYWVLCLEHTSLW